MPLFPDEFPFAKPDPAIPQAPPSSPAASTPPPQLPAETIPQAPPPQLIPPLASAMEVPIAAIPPGLPKTITQERRRSPRQSFLARAHMRHDLGNSPGWRVDLINISMLGLRVRSSAPLTPGDRAQVKLEVGPLRWATKLRVIHCQQLSDGNFAIGCEFVANELARPVRHAA